MLHLVAVNFLTSRSSKACNVHSKTDLVLKESRKVHYPKMLLNGITLSWATPFDAAELGARMEAYVETKALVLVFKLCVQRAQSEAPLGRLSPELIEMIATEVHDAAFKKKLKIWHKDLFCCANVCRPSEHLSAEQRKSLKDDYKLELRSEHEDDSGSDSDCGCGNHFDDYLAELGVGQDEHIDAVETTLAKVENNSYAESSGNFAKCRKVCFLFPVPTMEPKPTI